MRRSLFALWGSVSVMLTSLVGVGIFALPLAFARNGVWSSVIILSGVFLIVLFVQTLYGQISTAVSGQHDRLIGYVRHLAGPRAVVVTACLFVGTLLGALVAYIEAGSTFLALLWRELPVTGPAVPSGVFVLLFWVFVSAIAWRGMRFLRQIETWSVPLMLLGFFVLTVVAVPHIELGFLPEWRLGDPWGMYGAGLFSLLGFAAVPEMKAVLQRRATHDLPQAILLSLSLIFILYTGFSTATGLVVQHTTHATVIHAMSPLIGRGATVFATLLALLTITSIFAFVSAELRLILHNDLKIPTRLSHGLTLMTPLGIALVPQLSLGTLIPFVGAVFGGLLACMIIWLFGTIETNHRTDGSPLFFCPPVWLRLAVVGCLLVGVFHALFAIL